jgi:serine/threonine protein kinase
MQVSIGNYILVRPLGEGGMGTVYLAQHYHLRYYAVVKSLHPHYAQNEALRQRFFTEAQVMAQLSHPAIVRLYDFVIHEGVPYLIMEYVQGTPLDEVIATRGALSPEEGYLILSPIWEALHYLHSQKIIHRDIKPSNIMVLPEGGAKLIDFGIAKALDSDYKLTQTGMQVGTVLYMAPEQIQGNPVSF